jgi:hypothetical protein
MPEDIAAMVACALSTAPPLSDDAVERIAARLRAVNVETEAPADV